MPFEFAMAFAGQRPCDMATKLMMTLKSHPIFCSFVLGAALTCLAGPNAFAQVPTPTVPPVKNEQESPQEKIVIETNLVLLRVAAMDRTGRALTGLKKDDFKVYENGVEQPISFFSAEEAPATWGLVLDRSGSMMEMIRDVYQAAIHVIDEGTEEDEMFVLTFSDKPELVQDFTTDRHTLENSVLGLRAGGQTALYDAVAYALDHIRNGRHRKKVLVVLTDGEDNSSHLKFRKLVERAEEEDVLIYTVGMFEGMDDTLSKLLGRMGHMSGRDTRGELEKLSGATGAFAHFPTDVERCQATMREIAREVSQQYGIGYYPSNKAHDGKWRTIKITLSKGGGKYVARTRTGYYAPKESEVK